MYTCMEVKTPYACRQTFMSLCMYLHIYVGDMHAYVFLILEYIYVCIYICRQGCMGLYMYIYMYVDIHT